MNARPTFDPRTERRLRQIVHRSDMAMNQLHADHAGNWLLGISGVIAAVTLAVGLFAWSGM